MSASNSGLQQVVELASHLSPEEQVQLILRIQRQLPAALGTTGLGNVACVSPTAILSAVGEPPHISSETVDELERAIAVGKMPIRQEGIFDKEYRG